MTENAELILKTLQSADLANGGQLTNKQFKQFIKLIRTYNGMLDATRYVTMTQKIQEFDKMHFGEPVLRPAVEATAPSFAAYPASYTDERDTTTLSSTVGAGYKSGTTTYRTTPKFDKIVLSAVKFRADAALSTESLQENIEGNDLEGAFWDGLAQRFSHDAEEVIMNGDTALTTAATLWTVLQQIRGQMNGWGVITDSSIILDAGGDFVGKQMFSDALRMMPKEYRRRPGMQWIMGDTVHQDWIDMLTERVGEISDDAMRGMALAPFGKPILQSGILREDIPLITANNVAQAVSGAMGPWELSTTKGFQLVLAEWDGDATPGDSAGAEIFITMPAGTWDAEQIVTFLTPHNGFGGNGTYSKPVVIGATVYRAIYYETGVTGEPTAALGAWTGGTGDTQLPATWRAVDMGDGRFAIYSTTASSTFDFVAGTGTTDLLAEFGFSASQYVSTGGTQREGTYVLLTQPKNLMWGMLDGIRTFTEFKKDSDVIETTLYTQIAAAVEDLRGVVKIANVRRRTAWPT